MSNVIGVRIRQLRKARGLTQEELGEVLGVQGSVVSKYERGEVANLKASTISKMASFFNVSPVYIAGMSDTIQPLKQREENEILDNLYNILPTLNDDHLEVILNIAKAMFDKENNQ